MTYYPATYYSAKDNIILNYTISGVAFTATGLVFDTEYMLEVLTVNIYGTGPPANTILQTAALQGMCIKRRL